MTFLNKTEKKPAPVNKKIATMALAGMLAMGSFSAAPAFAGGTGNGCNANGCKSETKPANCAEKNSCKSKNGCKSSSSCQGKSGCHGKSGCQGKSSCKSKSAKDSAGGHETNGNYND